jgi:PLP dependent protein
MSEIADNYSRLREQAAQAAVRCGRDIDNILIVAVSKMQPVESILEAYDAGIRDFGESYVQEAVEKIDHPALQLPDIRWHFIGHLQSNKVRFVVPRFHLIHSVDSLKLAGEVSKRAAQEGRIARILLEVKLDSRDSRAGILPQIECVTQVALGAAALTAVRLEGLMGIAPYNPDADAGARAETARLAFRQLNSLFCGLPEEYRKTLSMGMTGDFQIAIEEGASLIRIGTALFGRRNYGGA